MPVDMALFQNCSVLFELKGLSFKEKKKIKSAVTDNGGRIAFVANKECSLVVTSDVSSLSSNRCRSIQKFEIPVVGINYVHSCLEVNRLLLVDAYKLDISPAKDPTSPSKGPKAAWPGNKGASPPSKDQTKPEKILSVTQSGETSQAREPVAERYRVWHEAHPDLPTFPESFQVAKYSLFERPYTRTWCLLELQSAKSGSGRVYRVVRYRKKDIESKDAAVRDRMVFSSTSEEAVMVFEDLTNSVKAEGLGQQTQGPPQVTEMGSGPLQQLLLEEKLHTGALSPEVGQFVERLWQEALGCTDLILNTPVHKISLNDVTRAEGLLLQVQRKITENKNDAAPLKDQCTELLTEYCSLLPQRSPIEPDMSSISKQFDLCQLIRDILNVSEMTLGSPVLSSVGKYRALRCSIEAVPKGSSEFTLVTALFNRRIFQVHQVLRVDRATELQSFRSELGNVKTLLHSTKPHNFVGILSRGLLMPSVAVSEHGVQRTDAGDLGSGIYFSDDSRTVLQYSQCSFTDGSRFALVCDVALGNCSNLFEKDPTLVRAPEGYDSVHGVTRVSNLAPSQFQNDEYVVYSPDQVKLKYVVQLILEGDELQNFPPPPETVLSSELAQPSIDQGLVEEEDAVVDIKNPLDNVTAGLLNGSGQQIPLQAVHVKCKLVDLLAQVIIFQKYTNESPSPIEAKYVFPLDESAAVCGFEAFINGKHVVGQVKEKETARREYKQAIEKGHGAYLMDQDAPDVFTISVGNLPPGATVLIKVTFVSELVVKDGSVFFSLPSSVAPWQESAALNQTTQATVQKVCVADEGASTREFNLEMSIEMPHKITEVKCITHQVGLKKTDCKAVVSVLSGEKMGPEGFQILVTLTEIHVPRMWVEQHPDKDSQACMLVFYPKFEATARDTSDEVVLLLDSSNSMKGESLKSARMIALQILKTLDHNIPVNVIFFGTDHKDAFLCARPLDKARQDATNFIKRLSSAGGSTELWRPLRALSLLPPSRGTRNLLLLSDGHIQNPELALQLLRDNAAHTRLFTCGLSSTANRHMLRALAQAGGGAYEFFDSKSKHTWSQKLESQVKRIQAPGASSVSVKWQQFNPTAPPPVQAPNQLHALFNDCHTLVFGFVPHCTKATLFGNLSGQEIETMVSTSELQKTKGTFLHKLTARAVIQDFEDGSLDSNAVLHEEKKAELKTFIIELSKEYSILSQFTSFVAIEERDAEEETGFTDIPKLIAEEDVDFLPYMNWIMSGGLEEEQFVEGEKESVEESEEYDEGEDDEYERMAFADCYVMGMEDSSKMPMSSSSEGSCDYSPTSPSYETRALSCTVESDDDMDVALDTVYADCLQHVSESEISSTTFAPESLSRLAEPSKRSGIIGKQARMIKIGSAQSAPLRPMQYSNFVPFEKPPSPPPVLLRASFSQDLLDETIADIQSMQPPPCPPPALAIRHRLKYSGALKHKKVAQESATPAFLRQAVQATQHLSLSDGSASLFGTRPQSHVLELAPVACSVEHSGLVPEPQSGAGPQFRAMRPPSGFVFSEISDDEPPLPPPFISQFGSLPDLPAQQTGPQSSAMPTPFSFGSSGYSFTHLKLPPPHGQVLGSSAKKFKKSSVRDASQTQQQFNLIQPDLQRPEELHRSLVCKSKEGLPEHTPPKSFLKVGSGYASRDFIIDDFGVEREEQSKCRLPLRRRGRVSKWPRIFSLQHSEGYWDLTPALGSLLNCDMSHFADDFLKTKGIASLGVKAHADILKMLATLLVLQLMRLEKIMEGKLLRTLFCLEDTEIGSEHLEAVKRAVKWVCWADRQYPCICSRLEFGLNWDSSTKQLLGAEKIPHCSPLAGFNLNPSSPMVL